MQCKGSKMDSFIQGIATLLFACYNLLRLLISVYGVSGNGIEGDKELSEQVNLVT